MARPRVIAVTALSCSEAREEARRRTSAPSRGVREVELKRSTYKRGVAVRCARLAPKTAVPTALSPRAPFRSERFPRGRSPRRFVAARRYGHRRQRSAERRSTRESHCRGTTRSNPAVIGNQHPRHPDRWPDSEDNDNHHYGERPERQDEGVESEASGGLRDTCLAEGCNRRQSRGDHHGARRTGEGHDEIPRHCERDELSAIRSEGSQRGIVLALHDALTRKGLAHHRQSDESSQQRQEPPPDGLRVDRRLDGFGLLLLAPDSSTPSRAQGAGSHLESREVGSTAAQADQVHIAKSCLSKHRTPRTPV